MVFLETIEETVPMHVYLQRPEKRRFVGHFDITYRGRKIKTDVVLHLNETNKIEQADIVDPRGKPIVNYPLGAIKHVIQDHMNIMFSEGRITYDADVEVPLTRELRTYLDGYAEWLQ